MTNYGTFMDKFIENYKEMLAILVQARIASDRIDEWQKSLEDVMNPEPRSKGYYKTQYIDCQAIIDGTFKYDKIDYEKYV